MPEPIYEKGQRRIETDAEKRAESSEFQFEVFKHKINSLAQLLVDLENIKGKLSSEEWSALGEILKDMSATIEETRDDIASLKKAVEEVKNR